MYAQGERIMSRAKELEHAVTMTLGLLKFDFMRVENYRCFRCGQVQNSKASDWPDFFVYHPILLAIECKTGSGQLTPGQKEVFEKLSKNNIDCVLVHDSVDSLILYLQERKLM